MKRYIASVAALLLIISPIEARAELLWFKTTAYDSPETAKKIESVTRKQRFFGRLSSKDDVDYYSMTVDEKAKIEILLESPVSDGDFRPVIVLFGPGLSAPKEDPTIPIGETNGAIVGHAKEERERRFDQFLMTSYSTGPSISISAPRKATYGLAVRSPKGSTGRYVLHIGTENNFKWSELIQGIKGTLKGLLRMY